ncbi:DUF1365 domain-containing protein [Alteromonas sp. ASW11-36]|uniref:DUF1365 domain-containing protein n=1 Tax=Alteromonas arenosi TaxID=3055817 RepID=A0ABT7SUC1_9ALTE|nr:DUF1365 domain-containing protein [Alteromonas sp. ASW11-36]MDM7859788.1 DUF1365 domain-containing protein [Alteromonas sp. ASW11-36]
MESALYTGEVFHQRVVPKNHQFTYKIFLFWLKLSEIDTLNQSVSGFSSQRFAPARFKRSDFLGSENIDLEQAVLERCNQLSEEPVHGEVFMLGQLRVFGLYFSPVNFYFVRAANGVYTHMLAEVSNTPWNKRHHYLVDLNKQSPTQKMFHVSPFNPMDMIYQWSVQQPNQHLRLTLSCYQKQRHFTAALNMTKMSLNSTTLRRVMLSIPSMTIKTVVGIYWQALKLFFKRVPFYSYPSNNKEH